MGKEESGRQFHKQALVNNKLAEQSATSYKDESDVYQPHVDDYGTVLTHLTCARPSL